MYSLPTVKTLDLLEYLSGRSVDENLAQLSKGTGISQATLLRMLNVLEDYGYIRKSKEKRYQALFKIEKDNALHQDDKILIDNIMDKVIKQGASSVEFLQVRGENLFWVKKLEQSDLAIRIAARSGFQRGIYELDAPSRLYLKTIGKEKAAAKFDTGKFYDTAYSKVTWLKALQIFDNEDHNKVIFDKNGNSNGIRRFAVLLGTKDNYAGLLSIAEAAIPLNNTENHINQMIKLLEEAREIFLKTNRKGH